MHGDGEERIIVQCKEKCKRDEKFRRKVGMDMK